MFIATESLQIEPVLKQKNCVTKSELKSNFWIETVIYRRIKDSTAIWMIWIMINIYNKANEDGEEKG